MEKRNLSAFQMGVLMYPTVLATGFLALPTITAQSAKNDLWLTCIFASFIGLLTIYMAFRLHELYPGQTLVQYSERILGKLLGKLYIFVFLFYILNTSGTITRQYAEFVKGNFLFKTPITIIMSFMILLCAIAVRGGVEMLARCAIIFTPIFILPLFILLLLIPDLDAKQIFPVLSHGLIPVFKGSAQPIVWMSEFFLISFFLPHVSDPEKGKKWSYISLCSVTLSLTYVNLLSLFLLGPDTGNKIYPILVAFRYISIGNIFENMEALLLAMWIVGNFIKISAFLYVAVHSLRQWLHLSDDRHITFPLGILVVVLGIWDLPDSSKIGENLKLGLILIPSCLALIPLILLIIAVLRKQRTTDEGESSL